MKSRCWLCEGDGMDGCVSCESKAPSETCKNAQVRLPIGDHEQMTIFDLLEKKDSQRDATTLDSAMLR